MKDHQQISPELQARHAKSVADYPFIKFMPNEYLMVDVKRSVWGLVKIWAIAIVASITFIAFAILVTRTAPESAAPNVILISIAMVVLSMAIAALATNVYRHNHLYITNERAIMRIQTSPFSYKFKNVELENIEDCSYAKDGLVHSILNFGLIRLSTIGKEHTYTFTWVDNPRRQFETINPIIQEVDKRRRLH